MSLRIGWIGVHVEGLAALEAVLASEANVVGVITLAPGVAAHRSGAADYAPLCRRYSVPLHAVANINESDAVQLLERLAPDVLFVIGWSQILRAPALRTARIGVVGAHASLLPHNRGSAPVNWALIRGERATGNTLIWLAEDVDAGAMIDQTPFPISPYDTCATLYGRVAESNRDMILRLLPRLAAGERPARLQPTSGEPLLPRRRPGDGLIPWDSGSAAVYDFVRALTKPYPGAFSWLDGKRWTVWSAALLPTNGAPPVGRPGEILGPVVSPLDAACGLAVACGRGVVQLLELEADGGDVVAGRRLAEQPWAGRVWTGA